MISIRIVLILFIVSLLMFPSVMAAQNMESKNMMDGSSWTIGEGYYIMVEGVDYEGEQGFVSIWRDGEMLREELLHSGDRYEYRDDTGTIIVSMKVSSIFRGIGGSMIRFSDIYLRYSGSGSAATATRTSATAVSTETPGSRDTENIDFGEGAVIPSLSIFTVMVLLLSASFFFRVRRGQ